MEEKYRDMGCGKVSEKDIGKEIKVCGFVENIRDHGGVLFLDLRDESGWVQLVSNDDKMFAKVLKESSICAVGIVRERDVDDYNDKISTGKLEILVSSLKYLGKVEKLLPFDIKTSHEVNEEVRLKYRYLDLRNRKNHDLIVFRSEVIKYIRNMMDKDNFLEITTPIITASSPEGARDFIVPSRKFKGKFYALPQAPQIFKQLLMVSGFEKYFQIAPCFRDEDARSDRLYGEFYQLDLEMAYVNYMDIINEGEKIFRKIFTKFGDKKVSKFKMLTYRESMELYGTDKPDLRNPLTLKDVSEIFEDTMFKPFRKTVVKAIVVDDIANKSNTWFNELVEYANGIGMPGIGYFKIMDDMSFNGPIDKFLSNDEREKLINKCKLKKGSVIFFIADRDKAYKYASLIRLELGRKLDIIDDSEYKFCVIKDFPMYEFDIETDKYEFCHNPFSMPIGGMDSLDKLDMKDIYAYQFDFVCNGVEMASGAVRNHDIDIMKKAFSLVGYSEEVIKSKFASLYEAFHYGAPPHAGMAIGIERMLQILKNTDSIREVVAFPMNSQGECKMMGCPSMVSEMQLREVHIKMR
ncbi:MAG: aspartate--tRNA ligase [Bacilli bacterium]